MPALCRRSRDMRRPASNILGEYKGWNRGDESREGNAPGVPIKGPMFTEIRKQPRIFFYTSSEAKFLHARTVLARFGIALDHFVSKRDPYTEDYSLDKLELLEEL